MACNDREAALRRLVVDGHRRLFPAWLACRDDAATPDLAMERGPRTCSHRIGSARNPGVRDRYRSNSAWRRVMAFNHASYVDAVVVAAVLPGEPTYVVKKELANQVFAGPLLRRLGVLFLERFELTDSLADLDSVTGVARQRRLLVFFPEGTFTRRAGLPGFYLGAFRVAAEAKLPVIPAILRGTRSMLRGEQWFPRWSPISVTIEIPIQPSGTDFASVVQLRDAVRPCLAPAAESRISASSSNRSSASRGSMTQPPSIPLAPRSAPSPLTWRSLVSSAC